MKRALSPLDRLPGPMAVAIVCGLGLALRLLVAYLGHGSNDIDTWQRFAAAVRRHGVLRTYELEPKFNHPPLMGYYAAVVDQCALALGVRFDIAFKLLPILASTATIFMVQRLARLKLLWLLLFALNPTDVLISAYHGNTDSLCAACAVACVLFADRERPFLSGLLLGAAINVKLIPVVLIAPLALSFPVRQMWRFAAGLALGVLPFLPVFVGPWAAFESNAIAYNSQPARFGVALLLSTLDGPLQPLARELQPLGAGVGKALIVGSSAAFGLVNQRVRLLSRAELAAITFSCFLVFASGFGVQYLVYPSAFFAASIARGGFRYTYLAGAFAFLLYYGYWTGGWPATSHFTPPFDLRSVLIGFLLWIWLACYLGHSAKRTLSPLFPWLTPGREP